MHFMNNFKTNAISIQCNRILFTWRNSPYSMYHPNLIWLKKQLLNVKFTKTKKIRIKICWHFKFHFEANRRFLAINMHQLAWWIMMRFYDAQSKVRLYVLERAWTSSSTSTHMMLAWNTWIESTLTTISQ